MPTIAEIMRDILIETDNPAVMYGDCGLLDSCANRAGMQIDWPPMKRWRKVLAALERSKSGQALFEKRLVAGRRGVPGNPVLRSFLLRSKAVQAAIHERPGECSLGRKPRAGGTWP